MGFVLRTKTSQLHTNQIRQRNQSNSVQRAAATQIRRGFWIIGPHLLTRKNQMHARRADGPAACTSISVAAT